MRHIHRTSFYMTPVQRRQIEALGFPLPPGVLLGSETPLVAFDAAEDHPNWPALCKLFGQWKVAPHSVRTEFTPRELDAARWLSMTAWNNGYPQPEEDEKFLAITYDLTMCCNACKLGKVQNAPFRIKGEPKWGRRGIMTLLWVHEEFFVPPSVWETIFKPFGIMSRPVANRRGEFLETVVQLVIEDEVDIVMDGLDSTRCDACGRCKYHRTGQGQFPPLAQEPKGGLARTRQSFGSGWECIRAALISQDLRRAIVAHKLRGAEFIPVESHVDAFQA
jgi:hypothetical protein